MSAEALRSPSDSTPTGADALPTLLRKLVLFGIAIGAMLTLACGGGTPEVGQLKTGPKGAGAIPESEATEGTIVVAVPNRTPIAPAAAAPAPTAAPIPTPAIATEAPSADAGLGEGEPSPEPSATGDLESSAEPSPTPEPQLNLAGVRTQVNLPGQIQFVFSPRDENNRAIVVSAEAVRAGMRIFEQVAVLLAEEEQQDEGGEVGAVELLLEIEEILPAAEELLVETAEWEEIDYAETSLFVHSSENFQQEVVFVLDFTKSMALTRLPDGTEGVNAMLDAFFKALAAMPAAHRVGVVEFHGRNVDPGVVSALTTDRAAIRRAVSGFVTSLFDSGSSRVWDSIEQAASLFTNTEINPDVVKAIVFFSDGRDTSSDVGRRDVFTIASDDGIQLYAVGIGDVLEEAALEEMAVATGGAYFPITDLASIQSALDSMEDDLRGQCKVSYLTLRRQGSYTVRLEFTLGGRTGVFESGPLDVASFYGPDSQGQITFDPPSLDVARGQARVFVRALHVPRNIDRIRFRLGGNRTLEVSLVPRAEGGLLEGWDLSGPDAGGYYEVSSNRPVEFGNFGLLFQITLSAVPEEDPRIYLR